MKRPLCRLAALVLLITFVPLMSGCFGRFPLTNSIYGFNEDLGDETRVSGRLFESVMFWVLMPIYGLAFLGDTLVIHLVEFWSGEPLDVGSAIERDGTTVALLPGDTPDEAILLMSRDGQVIREERLVRVSSTVMEIRSSDNQMLGQMVRSGGEVKLMDAEGRQVKTLGGDWLAAAH